MKNEVIFRPESYYTPAMKLSSEALKEKLLSKNLQIQGTLFLYSFPFHKIRFSDGMYLRQIHRKKYSFMQPWISTPSLAALPCSSTFLATKLTYNSFASYKSIGKVKFENKL